MKHKIGYKYERSLIQCQAEAEQQMLTQLETGSYTVKNPLVKLNPYLISPLTAVLLFDTEEETAVTLRICGKMGGGDMAHTFLPSKRHILPVLGLYPGYKNKVELTVYQGERHTVTIETEELDGAVPVLCSMKTTEEYMKDDLIFVTPSLNALATAFDYAGDIRWHLNVPVIFDMKRLKNGNVLIGTERIMRLPYYMSGLYEMTLCGKIVKEYRIPGGYHHDQWEMEDGNLLVLTDEESYRTVEDVIVLIDRNTGKVLKKWDLKSVLVPGEGPSGGFTETDWFHNNALWYDQNTNSITLSGRHVDSIVNIGYESGALNWILGDPAGWPQDKLPYFLKPEGDGEFDWHYEQHACLVTPGGDIMCFDNGHYRSKFREKFRLNKDNFSRGVRYRLNLEAGTVKQLWQYGKERGQEFFSSYIGNVEYYQEGHYMIHSGGIQYEKDQASETPAALKQDNPDVRTESITVELFHDQVMMELKITGNFYRAEKMKLYHEKDRLVLGRGKQLGRLGVTPEFDTHIPMETSGELLPDRYEGVIKEEDDRFTFHGIFEGGQLVMLQLEREGEEHAYFISTSKNKLTALCCSTFISKDPRSVTLIVAKEGLYGTYDVRVIVDDKKYETGIRITC